MDGARLDGLIKWPLDDVIHTVMSSSWRALLAHSIREGTCPDCFMTDIRGSVSLEQACRDWQEGRFPKVPGNDEDYIPLP